MFRVCSMTAQVTEECFRFPVVLLDVFVQLLAVNCLAAFWTLDEAENDGENALSNNNESL